VLVSATYNDVNRHYWKIYCANPHPTGTASHKRYIKELAPFEFDGTEWSRSSIPYEANGGHTTSWDTVYASADGRVLGSHPRLKRRGENPARSDPKV
jgi:hypothetical protein